MIIVILLAATAILFFQYFKRFCDWVPIIQQDKQRMLLQVYPIDDWYGYVAKPQALKMFEQGTQAEC